MIRVRLAAVLAVAAAAEVTRAPAGWATVVWAEPIRRPAARITGAQVLAARRQSAQWITWLAKASVRSPAKAARSCPRAQIAPTRARPARASANAPRARHSATARFLVSATRTTPGKRPPASRCATRPTVASAAARSARCNAMARKSSIFVARARMSSRPIAPWHVRSSARLRSAWRAVTRTACAQRAARVPLISIARSQSVKSAPPAVTA